MDIISFNEAAIANGRIEKFNANPDSNSGIITQPKVIEAGETVTIKSGRQAILADTVVNGKLLIEAGGSVFVPAGEVISGTIDGNAATAVKLQTARTINGVAFDGSADIIISDATAVKLTENQTVGGIKTFTSSPIVPTPTEEFQVATKKYVDDIASVGGSGLTAEDKTKLDGIEAEATKNKTDGFLLSRSNHTGTIPMSVVENLEQALADIGTGGSSGMTPAELLRIKDIESDITKKADLDSSGKIPASQLPDIASGRKIEVNSEADRLALSVYPDLTIANQMDDGSSWAINGNDNPSIISNWTKLGSALISQVSSFNGRTGNVFPETGDYTSDMITETAEKKFVSNDEKISWNNRLADANKDGKLYGRMDGIWTEIVSTGGGADLSNYYTKSETYNKGETDSLVDTKQDNLVSGTSIKTINGQNVLGSGNLALLDATNPSITGSITEQVYNLTGTEINPTNGTIQYKTVSANTTFTETLTAGQSVILRLIGANSKTITFPTITWVGAVAPVLTANCAIVLWKEQSILYGAYVGTLV